MFPGRQRDRSDRPRSGRGAWKSERHTGQTRSRPICCAEKIDVDEGQHRRNPERGELCNRTKAISNPKSRNLKIEHTLAGSHQARRRAKPSQVNLIVRGMIHEDLEGHMKWGFSFGNGLLVLSCFAALILGVPLAGAQLLQGTIDGNVMDSSQAAVPGAVVTAKD